jgi:serine-type D-Ala-D-Ala carboxypeptidase/endopeptidase (penicillin-binding protein 4)
MNERTEPLMKSRTLRNSLFILAALLSCGLAFRALADKPAKAPDTLEGLQKQILSLITHPRYNAALWGIKIASLDSGKTLFEYNSEKLFTPASNSKLYTMALALTRLGPDYRIKTSLYAKAKPDESGTLNGDLIVYGRGDPTISGEYNNQNVLKSLEPLVAALTNAGVKQITGNLIGDCSYYHSGPYGAGWSWDDMENDYGAEISALTINSNVLQLLVKPGEAPGSPAKLELSPPTTYITIVNQTETTAAKTKKRTLDFYHPVGENTIYVSGKIPMDDPGSSEDATMHDPAGLFVSLFKDVLAQHGITVAGKTRSMNWRDRAAQPLDFKSLVEIGSIQSRPMREIIRSVQKPSQNLYTDLMLEHVGTRAGLNEGEDAEDAGIRELDKFLKDVGIKRGDTIFEEGSGLSRNNVTTPNATVTLLTYMSRQKTADVYFNALPVAGVDGTLHNRMKGTAAAGNVHAKTGTLHWANSFSGYMTNAVGEHLVFSIMLNRFENTKGEHDRPKTADMDAIAEMLANFKVNTKK